MRQIRRIPALLLAVVMLCSLTLTGCGKKETPVPGDQVAVALFEMILKDDASKMVDLFGYADEAEAREDMGLGDSIYDELAEELASTFSAQGARSRSSTKHSSPAPAWSRKSSATCKFGGKSWNCLAE